MNPAEQRVFDLYDDYCHGRIDRRDYHEPSATLAWERTIAFFKTHLA